MVFLIVSVITTKVKIIYLLPLYYQVQSLKLAMVRVFVKMMEAVNVTLVMVDLIAYVNH